MITRFLPIVFILIAVGVFFGFVHPRYSVNVHDLRAEIAGYDSALTAARAFEAKQAALMEERNAIPAEDLERIDAFLPDGVDNIQMILDLNALADRSEVELSDFDIEVPQDDNDDGAGAGALETDLPYESLELSLTAVGTYDAFKNFLHSIEWSLRPMDLVSLGINDSPTGVYTYSMTFRIYWLR